MPSAVALRRCPPARNRGAPTWDPCEKAVRQALEGLKVWPLLTGYRGAPPADIEALIAAVLALAAFVEAEQHRLVELDINPLFVHAEGEAAGVSVVDALIRFSPVPAPSTPRNPVRKST